MAMRKATAKRKPVRKATKKKTTRKKRALPNAWSAKDVGYLKKNYKTQTAPQIAKVLKRTVAAVRAKATTLGLKKGVVRKKAAAKKKARKVVARKRTM
ncbi:MAG: hypothetical protein KAT58_03910, partial [candidate division Zixibacteria bacterium]|nr:hypothetical protein [candidate division Zixibacteria bacterium]